MAKKLKLFKKKSFWAKLSLKNKIGIAALSLAIVGGGSAYALSQSDLSLQSKASLSCEDACNSACTRIRNESQKTTCINSCISSKCGKSAKEILPPACSGVFKYVTLEEKRGKLNSYQMRIAQKVAKRYGENIVTSTLSQWYSDKCIPQQTCSRDWSKVNTRGNTYYWSDGNCVGYKNEDGCSKNIVNLTSDEIAEYKGWLLAGKPPSTNLCPMPEPTPTSKPIDEPTPTPAVRPGCYLQQVKCYKEPCDPIMVCSTPAPYPTACPRLSCPTGQQTIQLKAGTDNSCPIYSCAGEKLRQ